MTNKTYIITNTAGHSEKDSGAVTKKDGKLIKEADLAVKFRNAVLHYLQQDKSIITRTDGYGKTNLSLNDAAKLIDGADLSIEWHLNASSNPTATGVETIALPKDKVLAQKISSVVAQAFELKLRGQDGWVDQSESARGKLLFVSKGGLIGELGFISSTKDLEAFESRYWVAAKAVAEVMIEYVADEHRLAEERCIGLYNTLVDGEDGADNPDTDNKE